LKEGVKKRRGKTQEVKEFRKGEEGIGPHHHHCAKGAAIPRTKGRSHEGDLGGRRAWLAARLRFRTVKYRSVYEAAESS